MWEGGAGEWAAQAGGTGGARIPPHLATAGEQATGSKMGGCALVARQSGEGR